MRVSALLDPLRNFCVRWICEEFFDVSVHNISASFQVFHFLSYPRFIDLSKTGALVCGGGPFKRDGAPNCVASLHEVSLVSVSSIVVLCAVRWRVSSVSQCLFPVYVPDKFFLWSPISQPSVHCIRNCTQKWCLLLQNRINSWTKLTTKCEELVHTVFFSL